MFRERYRERDLGLRVPCALPARRWAPLSIMHADASLSLSLSPLSRNSGPQADGMPMSRTGQIHLLCPIGPGSVRSDRGQAEPDLFTVQIKISNLSKSAR